MAISVRASVAWAVVTADSTITLPTHQAGDRIYVFAAWKAFGTTAQITAPSGWTEVTEFADGSVANGAGVGSVKVGAWYFDCTSASETNPTLDWSVAPAPGARCAITLQKGAGETWDTPLFATAAIAAAINWTATASSAINVKSGAVVLEVAGFRDDSATMTRSTTTALEDDGSPNVTWNGNVVEDPATHASSATSNDISADLIHRFVTTGANGVNLTATGTLSASETGACLWVHQGVSADTTAPTLSSQTVGSITTGGGTPSVSTDEGNGTVYMVVVPNGDSPSVAQIKAGQNSSGGAALADDSQAVSGTGVQTFAAVTGLTSNTAYDCWFVHTDASANDSTAVKADFTTALAFNDIRQAIIDGIAGTGGDTTDQLQNGLAVTDVVRTSSTVVTITMSAIPGYDIASQAVYEVTVPASALTGGVAKVGSPTFTVDTAGAGPTEQPLSGAISFSGAGTKRTSRGLSGALSFAGALAKRTARALSGAASFSGALAAAFTIKQALTAALSFSGTATKRAGKALAGALSAAGATARRASRRFTAALTGSAALSKRAARANLASLSFSGAAAKRASRALAGVLSFTGAVAAAFPLKQALTAALGFSGAATRRAGKTLSGALALAGSVAKRTLANRVSALSLSGAARRSVATTRAAVLSFAGAVGRRVPAILTAALSFAGAVTARLAVNQILTAALSFAGATQKRAGKAAMGALAVSGAVRRAARHVLAGALDLSGSLARRALHRLAGALSFAGAVGRGRFKVLAAALSYVGSVAGQIIQGQLYHMAFTASLSFLGALRRRAINNLLTSVFWVKRRGSGWDS